MIHRITIIGFVGQPPQMRYTEDGTPVTNFSVATRQVVSKERVAGCPTGWKESLNGKNWELTTWFRVTCWRKLAEATNQFLFGYIRFAHFAAAMIMTVGFFGRIYWAFVGNHHARQMFYLPALSLPLHQHRVYRELAVQEYLRLAVQITIRSPGETLLQ